jgi:hypothetical protein
MVRNYLYEMILFFVYLYYYFYVITKGTENMYWESIQSQEMNIMKLWGY